MKGATAELCANTINKLKTTRIIMIGASQYLFLTFKNAQNSFKMDNFARIRLLSSDLLSQTADILS